MLRVLFVSIHLTFYVIFLAEMERVVFAAFVIRLVVRFLDSLVFEMIFVFKFTFLSEVNAAQARAERFFTRLTAHLIITHKNLIN